jgi:hypothetical protein
VRVLVCWSADGCAFVLLQLGVHPGTPAWAQPACVRHTVPRLYSTLSATNNSRYKPVLLSPLRPHTRWLVFGGVGDFQFPRVSSGGGRRSEQRHGGAGHGSTGKCRLPATESACDGRESVCGIDSATTEPHDRRHLLLRRNNTHSLTSTPPRRAVPLLSSRRAGLHADRGSAGAEAAAGMWVRPTCHTFAHPCVFCLSRAWAWAWASALAVARSAGCCHHDSRARRSQPRVCRPAGWCLALSPLLTRHSSLARSMAPYCVLQDKRQGMMEKRAPDRQEREEARKVRKRGLADLRTHRETHAHGHGKEQTHAHRHT